MPGIDRARQSAALVTLKAIDIELSVLLAIGQPSASRNRVILLLTANLAARANLASAQGWRAGRGPAARHVPESGFDQQGFAQKAFRR
jgi:hypothetical protein